MSKLTIDSILGNADIDFACESCLHQFKVKLAEVSNDKSIIYCPNCKIKITVCHTEETRRSKQNVDKALNSLEDTFKNFGK